MIYDWLAVCEHAASPRKWLKGQTQPILRCFDIDICDMSYHFLGDDNILSERGGLVWKEL